MTFCASELISFIVSIRLNCISLFMIFHSKKKITRHQFLPFNPFIIQLPFQTTVISFHLQSHLKCIQSVFSLSILHSIKISVLSVCRSKTPQKNDKIELFTQALIYKTKKNNNNKKIVNYGHILYNLRTACSTNAYTDHTANSTATTSSCILV